nr:MAG TPA: ArsC family reductase [Bacteriophage sp.]
MVAERSHKFSILFCKRKCNVCQSVKTYLQLL